MRFHGVDRRERADGTREDLGSDVSGHRPRSGIGVVERPASPECPAGPQDRAAAHQQHLRPEADTVGFSDRFPLTLLSTATVEKIKTAIDEEIDADRFRYNVLFTGSADRDEHHLARFKIGSFIGRGVKPCGRCNTINVDQGTAVVDATILERLHAHPDFHNRQSGEVVVSENAIVEREGAFTVRDTVEVIERRTEGWDRPYEPNHRRLPTIVVSQSGA